MKFLSMLLTMSFLVGCSSVTRFTDVTNLVDYSNHASVKVLDIPPDLDSPDFNKTYFTTVSDSMSASRTPRSVRLDQVPLVDKAMGVPLVSSVKFVNNGAELALQFDDSFDVVWARTNDTLKSIGMTVNKSEKKTGFISVRDRASVSDAASPIGRFLNRSLGGVNKGVEYQFKVVGNEQSTRVEVLNAAGNALPEARARQILSRLRRAYTS